MPLPQVLRHGRPEIRGAGIQYPRREPQQSPALPAPVLGLPLHLVGLRGDAVLLHRALEPMQRSVLEVCSAFELNMVEHEVGDAARARHAGHVLADTCATSCMFQEVAQ